MSVLERINKLRDERGWTDYRLAKEANIPQTTLINLHKRNNSPSLPTLETLCGALGITLAQFFSEEGEPAPLTEEQRQLLDKWQLLSKSKKEKVMAFIQGCLTD
ncbi:MAG: helix-turn-helix domain-containing protein [Oscillospiraceae bacterium]|nr:helix-turn-helix domain-containing protein [Oscillospiraceae bacterium]